jgi:hypothetical protein
MGFLFSLLIPSHVRISKAINIAAPKDSVLALIKDPQRWNEWHPAFNGSDSSRKFAQIHIVSKAQTDSTLVMEMQQGNKPVVINGWNTYEYQGSDSITLQWYMDFHLGWYPWKKFGSLFYESSYGPLMQEGLENLRKLSQR